MIDVIKGWPYFNDEKRSFSFLASLAQGVVYEQILILISFVQN